MDDEQYKVWLEKEMVQSKRNIEEKLKITVNTLAYPFGLHDHQVEAAAMKAGYKGVFNINMGLNEPTQNPFRLKRQIVVNSMGPKSLANLFGGKVLHLEILSPGDTDRVSVLPEIRFRVKTPGIPSVRLEVSKYQATLKSDTAGVYTYRIPGKLKRGFYPIIIRGNDTAGHSYLNSWSFLYRPKEI
jgi:hypothetical protein